jgi:hypothetical protein
MKPFSFLKTRAGVLLLGTALCVPLGGCALAGFIANAAPKPDIAAAYKGLSGQSVAIVVWAPEATRLDYPNVSVELSSAIQEYLAEAAKPEIKLAELSGTKFPVDSLSVIQLQEEHPELANIPVTDWAHELGVTRVIYLEVNDFETHSPASYDLLHGSVTGSLKVVAVDPKTGRGQIVYSEDNVHTSFPPQSPEGIPRTDENNIDKIYAGTVKLFAMEVSSRFYQHPDQDDN